MVPAAGFPYPSGPDRGAGGRAGVFDGLVASAAGARPPLPPPDRPGHAGLRRHLRRPRARVAACGHRHPGILTGAAGLAQPGGTPRPVDRARGAHVLPHAGDPAGLGVHLGPAGSGLPQLLRHRRRVQGHPEPALRQRLDPGGHPPGGERHRRGPAGAQAAGAVRGRRQLLRLFPAPGPGLAPGPRCCGRRAGGGPRRPGHQGHQRGPHPPGRRVRGLPSPLLRRWCQGGDRPDRVRRAVRRAGERPRCPGLRRQRGAGDRHRQPPALHRVDARQPQLRPHRPDQADPGRLPAGHPALAGGGDADHRPHRRVRLPLRGRPQAGVGDLRHAPGRRLHHPVRHRAEAPPRPLGRGERHEPPPHRRHRVRPAGQGPRPVLRRGDGDRPRRPGPDGPAGPCRRRRPSRSGWRPGVSLRRRCAGLRRRPGRHRRPRA